MRQALKTACQPYHDDIEGVMYSKNIQENKLSKDQLLHLLKINYYYFLEVESLLKNSDYSSSFSIDKTGILRRDIKAMGKTVGENSPIELGLASLSKEDVLGSLYVSIGSSLGGQMIYKKLKDEHPHLSDASFEFYESAKDTIKLWKKFLNTLEESKHMLNEDKLIDAAQKNFKYFKTLHECTQ